MLARWHYDIMSKVCNVVNIVENYQTGPVNYLMRGFRCDYTAPLQYELRRIESRKHRWSFLLKVKTIPIFLCNTENMSHCCLNQFKAPYLEIMEENPYKTFFFMNGLFAHLKCIIIYCNLLIWTTLGCFWLSKSPLLHVKHMFVIS